MAYDDQAGGAREPSPSPPGGHLRAGDEDREAVAERLRVAFSEGRLSQDELDERLQAAYTARTLGELVPITADLPAAAAARPTSRGTPPSPARHHVGPGLRKVWAAWLLAVSVNLVIWALVSLSNRELEYFWPMWVAGPWGAVLIATTVARWGEGGDDEEYGAQNEAEERAGEAGPGTDRLGRGDTGGGRPPLPG